MRQQRRTVPDQQCFRNQGVRSQHQYIGKDKAAVIKGEHEHPQHRFYVPPPGKQLPHDTGGKKVEVR